MGQPAFAGEPRLAMCSGKVRVSCVVDGDTFWFKGEKIRLADIDTPEISSAKCPAELILAAKATERLIELLNENDWELHRGGLDKFERTLATVVSGDLNLGDVMITEGLARRWVSGRRESWCAS